MNIEMSSLPKTWIFDIDGTIFRHNGYKNGEDTLIEGVKEFFKSLSEDDYIILVTARKDEFRKVTEEKLKKCGIRYNNIIFGVPCGERIIINDKKSSGLLTAHAININRDKAWNFTYKINKEL